MSARSNAAAAATSSRPSVSFCSISKMSISSPFVDRGRRGLAVARSAPALATTLPAARRIRKPTPPARPSGIAADGEAPGCRRRSRTRSDAGPDAEAQRRLEHRRPRRRCRRRRSRPRRPRTSGADHSRQGAAESTAGRRAGAAPGDGDPQQPVVDPRPGARADRAAEPVAVVGDEDRRARASARGRPARSSAGRAPRPRGRAPRAPCRGWSAASRRGSPRAGRPRRRGRARRC